jgi:hypothetical protein
MRSVAAVYIVLGTLYGAFGVALATGAVEPTFLLPLACLTVGLIHCGTGWVAFTGKPWSRVAVSAVALPYLLDPIVGSALGLLCLWCVWFPRHAPTRPLSFALCLLAASTLHLATFGYSDVVHVSDTLAHLITLPGVSIAGTALSLHRIGAWYAGYYPVALLAIQFALNLGLLLTGFEASRRVGRRAAA